MLSEPTMDKPIIILLLGTSGVGKTTVLEYLQNHYMFEVSKKFTTRVPRNTPSDKRDFIFCRTTDEFPKDNILIFQSYGAAFGIQVDQIQSSVTRGRSHILTVGDSETVRLLKRYFPNLVKTILLYCEYDILKSRITSSLDTNRAKRWNIINKEIQNIYSWLGDVDYILDCSMPFEDTKVKVDELIKRIRLNLRLKEKFEDAT